MAAIFTSCSLQAKQAASLELPVAQTLRPSEVVLVQNSSTCIMASYIGLLLAVASFTASVIAHEGHDHSSHGKLEAMAGGAIMPIPVTVYYESLCPDSIKFFKEQLAPTYKSLNKYIDLELVPYGKSSMTRMANGSWAFTCHHGERECYGNKVQACALDVYFDKSHQFGFISCLMEMVNTKIPNATYPAQQCASSNGLEYNDLEQCVNTEKGQEELAKMGNKTKSLQPPLASVPTVVFKKMFKPEDKAASMTNFKGVVCSYITEANKDVKECEGASNSAGIAAAFALVATCIVAHFIAS